MTFESANSIPSQARTRVGTGSTVLEGVDMRTSGGRRFRELVVDFSAHVGGNPSATQCELIKRAAGLAVWCAEREAEQATGTQLDVAAYTTAVNSLRRLLADLGFSPASRDVTPSLRDLIQGDAA